MTAAEARWRAQRTQQLLAEGVERLKRWRRYGKRPAQRLGRYQINSCKRTAHKRWRHI